LKVFLCRLEFGFSEYGILYDEESKIGAFQTKFHYRTPSPIALVEFSAIMLVGFAKVIKPVNVNFPGIGLGGLQREEVFNLLKEIWWSDDIIVWEK